MTRRGHARRFEREVRRAILAGGIRQGDRLVVAVSGGPDSLALLHALCRLRPDLELDLHCAHLDHGLRGDASTDDARFVAETCRELGVEHTAGAADVEALRREERFSPEEAAREARYRFLAQVASDRRAAAIVLGHTADDQAETVLMNMLRGSGLTGLRGMKPSSRRSFEGRDVLLLRPLLTLSKRDTIRYCETLGLSPRLDASNLSPEPTRNRVRLELLPLLEQINPAVRESIIALSRNAAQVLAHLEGLVESVWGEAVRVERDHVAVSKSLFVGLEPAVGSHLLRRAVTEVKGDLRGIGQGHIEDMALLMAGPAGRSLDLPGSLCFSSGYGECVIAPAGLDLCPLPPIDGEQELTVPGQTRAGHWRVSARLADRDGSHPSATDGPGPDGLVADLSVAAVSDGLRVRARTAGDRFGPAGMAGHKKVQDFMVDAKIPREWRDRVPMVVSERGIAWIVGLRVAEWAKPAPGDDTVLEVRFERED